jgi:hypothetical protein
MKATFAAAINCLDGRTQIPVIEYTKKVGKVDYVDMITEPAVCKTLAENKDTEVVEFIRRKLLISVSRHGSKTVVLAGHHDCTGNPTDKDTQVTQILASLEVIRSWNLGIRAEGVWVDENWQVVPIVERR